MKFAHLGDCHLGGWRIPELNKLNFESFQSALNRCIRDKVDFILIAGDLFDSAYPPIETLKETFKEFRKLKEANIPVFLIAGSHDYSVSGRTFLDVLAKAGFCKNVAVFEEKKGSIILEPTIHKNVALYGYPGRKSGLEVEDIEKIKLQDSPGLFKILMLHTTIRDAAKNPKIKAVNQDALPKVDYLALAHLHIHYARQGRVYSGPTFPNNLSELEELECGSYCIFNDGEIKREKIKLKEVLTLNIEIKDALTSTEKIINRIEKYNLRDKIIILKLFGILEKGKTSDVNFRKIESLAKERGAFAILKKTTKLHIPEPEIKINIVDAENLEKHIIKKFEESHPNKFNYLISDLMRLLQLEKLDDEKSLIFEERLISESKKVLNL